MPETHFLHVPQNTRVFHNCWYCVILSQPIILRHCHMCVLHSLSSLLFLYCISLWHPTFLPLLLQALCLVLLCNQLLYVQCVSLFPAQCCPASSSPSCCCFVLCIILFLGLSSCIMPFRWHNSYNVLCHCIFCLQLPSHATPVTLFCRIWFSSRSMCLLLQMMSP